MSTPVTSGGGGGSGRGGSLEAHLAKLEAALADRRERVAKLEEDFIPSESNYRYNINISVPYGPTLTVNPLLRTPETEIVETFIVKKDTRFYVKSIEFAFTVQGTILDPLLLVPIPGSLTLPPLIMAQVYQFKWKVRDTGSDRDWQDDFLPWTMLCSTHQSGFRFGRGHVELSGGSQVSVTVGTTFLDDAFAPLFGLTDITSVGLQFDFVGVEVPA